MASGTEMFNTRKEALANKDSSRLVEFFIEDFRFVSRLRNIGKQETLDGVDSNPRSMALDNLEVIYENDDVSVVLHTANSSNDNGMLMAVYKKKDGKFSHLRYVRQSI